MKNLCNCSFFILLDFSIVEVEFFLKFLEDLKCVKYVGIE